ncbi:MAG: replication restart helicase PriA [Bacteroides sp.]
MKYFIDVVIPLPIPGLFTYSVEESDYRQIQAGCRVIVPFGRKKYYTALVFKKHNDEPREYKVKPIYAVLDYQPILLAAQIQFWSWLSDYYVSALGDVFKAALPSGLKLESETLVELNKDYVGTPDLTPNELKVLDLLSDESVQCVKKLAKDSEIANILAVANRLLERGAIIFREELKQEYKPRMEVRIRFSKQYESVESTENLFQLLSNAPKQLDIVMKYMDLSGFLQGELFEVSKHRLLDAAQATASSLKGLINKGVLEEYEVEIGRLQGVVHQEEEAHQLNESQTRALKEINLSFGKKQVCLLHGVTSSGKTEVYIHLIQQILDAGKQVLYLLPEIALTTQITERLKRVFGDKLGVYHSKFSDAERVEIWKKQLSEQPYQVVLGVRSSIFLPFQNLGLVIVDEEHETTYKQQDPAPRYHARDAVIVLAHIYGANVLLGTATPSIETWHNVESNKYGLVQLTERYKEIELPEIIPVDIYELKRKKRMKGQFSPLLLSSIREALAQKEQIILFQNRRGFAPIVECNVCSWVPKCVNCDVSLTYHKRYNELTCHYCGYTYQLPTVCPSCESEELTTKGFGTEKVEAEIQSLFPNASVARMDLDTTRTRNSYEKIISDFEEGRTNILIGTQMISKGLDFNHVRVVGILNADTMLNYPDFRAYERAYQLMAQVSGRAGRHKKRGKVILQTHSIDHPIIPQVINNRYEEMVAMQLEERQLFHYPPYYRLIYVYLKHRDEKKLDFMARFMADQLRASFGARVLGPDKPPVGRVQTYFIKKIVIKLETSLSIKSAKAIMLGIKERMLQDQRFKSLIVYYDVDPM